MLTEPELPTPGQALLFEAKAWIFRVRRFVREALAAPAGRLKPQPLSGAWTAFIESRTPLFASANPAEVALEAGKVQNLRMAARLLHGVIVHAGEEFSFWRQVGRPVRARGFAQGRELREGCIIPSVGGGLCQISNALYQLAVEADCEIVERHAHSTRVPGSMAENGSDATVFWNYVDLRFRPKRNLQLEVRVEPRELVLRFRMEFAQPLRQVPRLPPFNQEDTAESCELCGARECFRHPSAAALPQSGVTAWLVDAFQPELNGWMLSQRKAGDWLWVPLRSDKLRFGHYFWTTSGFGGVGEARWLALKRSMLSRRLRAQGAARQSSLLAMDEELALEFARRLQPRATHLVVSQNLLPFLWRHGDLGGRTFDVLMNRLPLKELHRMLDRAAQAHPEFGTLADFRAPEEVVEAESAALAAAGKWVTAHSEIAGLAGKRAVHLPWQMPGRRPAWRGEWIIFPASTLARKGALEVRLLARRQGFPVRLMGAELEGSGFWTGVRTERAEGDWLEGARAVVLPAWVEHQPRRLLEAVAAGVPVMASAACGLEGVRGVSTFPTGDLEALSALLSQESRNESFASLPPLTTSSTSWRPG